MGQLWNRPARLALVAAAIAIAGCDATLKESTVGHLEDFISSVSDAGSGVQATLVAGDPPEAGAGPGAEVSGIGVMINGGSSQQHVNGSASFTRVIVAAQGMTNYYQLDLPAGVTAQDVVLGGATSAVARTMVLRYAVGDGGAIGPYATQNVRFLRVGTGDIQVSVAWDDTSDVDLHVIDPSGEEINFSHRTSASGGKLDLDGNPACARNQVGNTAAFVSNENVVWPTGTAPSGNYKVILDYWSSCGNASTDWVVTVQRTGASPLVVTGTFVGTSAPDDTVTTFAY
ncbi:MAG TPA: hypothetical protein VG817_12815 [Gemmatimonadales bacterium]|nr:hypothetical protein [Gemmatimonadales bacterium]